MLHVPALEMHAAGLEARTGIPRDRWFTGEYSPDPEMPGGGSLRTGWSTVPAYSAPARARMPRAPVRSRARHRLSHAQTIIDCLFPLTFSEGVLYPAV